MTGRFSLNSRKAILVLIEELFVVLAVISLTIMAVSVAGTETGDNIRFRTPVFERSDLFKALVEDRINEIVEASRLKSNFERQGEFYGRKVVDLAEYVEDNRISGQQTKSVGYKLSDLIHWSRKGLKYKYAEDRDPVVADAGMPDAFVEGELSEGSGVKIDLAEEYHPVHGRSLFDYSNESYSDKDLLDLLEKALTKVREDYQDYQELGVELKSENTNVRFFVSDYANSNTCSNIDTAAFASDDTIKTFGQYMILDSKSLEYESNMHVDDAYLFNLLTRYRDSFDGNYYLEIAVDTSYPVVDSISSARDEYMRYRPVVRSAGLLALIFSVCAFLCLSALTLSAGRKGTAPVPDEEKDEDEVDGVILLGFDRIKTEIFALFFGAVAIFGVRYGSFLIFEARDYRIRAIVIAAAVSAVLNLVLLAGYLSLVRRIKAGTLYRDSLTNLILRRFEYIQKGLSEPDSKGSLVIRELVLFVSVLALNLFLFYLGNENVENSYFIALAGLDILIFLLILGSAMKRRQKTMDSIKDSLSNAMESTIRNEKLKADLITNVSHDIKTPLTSIINYVDLLKSCDITDEKAREYIGILDSKSLRLKTLTDDLVEASKITSGNISIEPDRLDMGMMVSQMEGEVSDRFEARELTLLTSLPEETAYIYADGRRLFRILDNIYGNVAKYAMTGTRVYADLVATEEEVIFSLKNISSQPLNIDASELTERFIRGDVSRSSEGSGLGLSIAESLTKLMKGEFDVDLDGDLFKVTLKFERMK